MDNLPVQLKVTNFLGKVSGILDILNNPHAFLPSLRLIYRGPQAVVLDTAA
jgi:hypothetical protein